MSPTIGKLAPLALAAVAAAWLAPPTPAAAQVGLGVHYARAEDAFGGTGGGGVRVSFGLPLFPASAAINGEYFFPDCEDDRDCVLRGVTFDLNFALPMPGLRSWAGIGWSVRQFDADVAPESRRTERGLNIGIGAETRVLPLRPYIDLRYELADAPEDQLVVRLGLMLR